MLATESASRTNALIAPGRPVAAALTDGYHLAFWIAFGLVVAALAVAATMLRPARLVAAPQDARAAAAGPEAATGDVKEVIPAAC